ncbi:MAG: DUF3084 domain-containing protein, partial [Candidatus Wallbacteria bacterium]|nr:DUF3084 domain-containing protein [Candidatus Wallbacteria bacterium]
MSWHVAIRFFFLILFSGLLAYIGDVLGYRIGKMRISFFSLRPRVTAQVIAVGTGIVITFITIGFSSLISQEVRIALFNIDRLIEQQKELLVVNEDLKQKNEALLKKS